MQVATAEQIIIKMAFSKLSVKNTKQQISLHSDSYMN